MGLFDGLNSDYMHASTHGMRFGAKFFLQGVHLVDCTNIDLVGSWVFSFQRHGYFLSLQGSFGGMGGIKSQT